jgi:hypothetical protein
VVIIAEDYDSLPMDGVDKRAESPAMRRCKGTNKRGAPCSSTAIGPDGYCNAHGGRQDMRELGRKGGSVGKGNAGRRRAVLESNSLREKLRELDPDVITAACSEILAGSNGAAKVSVIRLVTDLETFRRDEDPGKGQLWLRAAAEEFDRKFAAYAERSRTIRVEGLRDDGVPDEIDLELKRLREYERRWNALPARVRAEFSAS